VGFADDPDPRMTHGRSDRRSARSTMLTRFLGLLVLVALSGPGLIRSQSAPCLSGSPGGTFLASANETRLNWVYAIRLRNDASARTLTAVEMFCGADWWISENVGWQGAQLRPAVNLAAFETFWLVWSTPRSIQLSVESATSLGEEHREGQFAPTGAPQRTYRWKYRLYCGGKDPGAFVTRGGPCGGVNRRAPRILADPSVPAVGSPFAVVIDRGPASASAWVAFGLQDQRLGGALSLPFDLGVLGAPGCQVHVDLLALAAASTDAAGVGRMPVALPTQAGLVGITFFTQWLVLEPGANPLGLVTSAGAACRVGN
jgi:hypothetical protein